jgi:arylsulfatase A-like enzyme
MPGISRRTFLGSLAGSALAAASVGRVFPSFAGEQQGNGKKPNIIFILADDLGYGDMGCYGQKLIQTPNIDKLAAEGMRFTQCYSGSTVCAPARSSLMTGQHTGHTRIRWNAPGYNEGRILLPEDLTVAEVLRDAGYATGAVGKWGLGEPDTTGHPNKQGFDFWFGYLDQVHAHEYYTDYLWKNEEKIVLKGNLNGKQTEYSNDLMAKEVLDFVKASKAKPFFLYHAFTLPHGKYQAPSLEPYADKPWPPTQKTYAAMVTRLDTHVGNLMTLLKELGIDRDTIVFFTSDNGPAARGGDWDMFQGAGPFRAKKGDLYEGGIRVPMIARWPGKIAPGVGSDQAWAFWDFLPTAAEIAGAKTPADIDGISMLPTLLGKPQKGHDFLYWESHQGGFAQAVRMGDWKAVRFGLKEPLELYSLKNDIAEKNNVAAKHPDIVAKIEKYLETARTDSPHWPSRDYRTQPKGGKKSAEKKGKPKSEAKE